MTQEEIEEIASAVVAKMKAEAAFHIPDEAHYNAHKRLDKFIESYDRAAGIVGKWLLGILLAGAIWLFYLGVKVKGGAP